MSLDDFSKIRKEKLSLLKEAGMDPYPASVPRTTSLKEFEEKFNVYQKKDKDVSLTGRIISNRGQGGLFFATLDDGTAKFQIVLKKEEISEHLFNLWKRSLDLGDIVSVTGSPYITKKEVESLLVKEWRIASKSLLPLPDKWSGLTDQDEKLRKPYLELLLNPDRREIFYKKAKFWKETRLFLEKKGFLEVTTPTLEITTGGAEARPFITHHNDFNLNLYLRISVGELWQKRLMAAGFPATYEIGRVYRNEGSSSEHLQEFTNMEFYQAYLDFEKGKKLVEKMYQTLAKKVFGTTSFTYKEHTFDLSSTWKEVDYVDTIKKMTGVDVLEATEKELEDALQKLNIQYDGANRERFIDSLWKYCRKQISGPVFLVNHPKEVAPLSKASIDDPRKTKTFQVIVAGSEVGRAHAELTDPSEQEERFKKQNELLSRGDEEAMMPDWDYVEMLKYGMPPTFGFGFGERFFSILAGENIRDTQLFPLTKPK